MFVEQIWNAFFNRARLLLTRMASPFISIARQVGMKLNAAQVWNAFLPCCC
jgi:hypothetical protein